MTALAICAIAFDSKWERYDSYHTPPEVKDYIASVSPSSLSHEYMDGGKFFKVDTTNSGGVITASQEVLVPSGEKRSFSYWLVQPDPFGPVIRINEPKLEIFKEEYGIVGLYFGLSRFPIRWPGFNIKEFDRFVHIMMTHVPGWEPPEPQPWGRRQ